MSDLQIILVVVVIAFPPTIFALAALSEAIKIHKAVNGKMDELIRLNRNEAHAAGILEEKERGK